MYIPLSAIPKQVQQAFLAAEDKNFYQHNGIDISGIARAIRENIANFGKGRSMVGGSTITQQVVKNFLLTNEKSIERKIKEAILAFRISNVYSKDRILELYLNQIYLGRGSYGVAAAATTYFNKPMNELTTEEIALLAGMPKAPSNYDPDRNPAAALQRRNYVISRMVDDGHISPEEGARAAATPIKLESRAASDVASAEYFAEEVRRQLAEMYGASVLYEGGLTVKTTVVPEYQKLADQALRHALVEFDRRHGYRGPVAKFDSIQDWLNDLKKFVKNTPKPIPLFDGQELAVVIGLDKTKATIGRIDGERATIAMADMKWARKALPNARFGVEPTKPADVLQFGDVVLVRPLKEAQNGYALEQIPEINGGLVVMDPHTGRVLAMAGGYAYTGDEFNRATQAYRQPGSSFKPFVYMTALENGLTPSTILMDSPIEIPQGPGLPMWRPQNYGGKFLGPTTLRSGLEKSRNTITVRIAQMMGLGRVIQVVKRFGIYSSDIPKNYSMVLGAKETTLLRMVTAYSMIANGGYKVESSLIERIHDRTGKIIYRRDKRECKNCLVNENNQKTAKTPPELPDTRELVMDPRIAYQLTSLMEGVVQRGTATRAKILARPIAGKTGTTNDSRDVWFIGFTPDLVAGIYVGYDQPRNMGKEETGGRVALPGFIEFMQQALADVPPRAFRIPEGIRMVQVDHGSGAPPTEGGFLNGKLIAEAFIVGEKIYKPPLPEGEQPDPEEPALTFTPRAASNAASYNMEEPIPPSESDFNPGTGWQDNYYLTPDQARWRDQNFQMQHRRPLPGNKPQPAPAPQATPEGFQPQDGTGTAPATQAPVARERGYNRDSAASYGTGGLY